MANNFFLFLINCWLFSSVMFSVYIYLFLSEHNILTYRYLEVIFENCMKFSLTVNTVSEHFNMLPIKDSMKICPIQAVLNQNSRPGQEQVILSVQRNLQWWFIQVNRDIRCTLLSHWSEFVVHPSALITLPAIKKRNTQNNKKNLLDSLCFYLLHVSTTPVQLELVLTEYT